MIQLARYFAILFLNKNISRSVLFDFAESHILRLAAHNPGGIFTGILNDATTAFNNYFGAFSSELVNQALRKSRTAGMNESRDALKKAISDSEKIVAYTYRNNKSKIVEFYPTGITEYLVADMAQFFSLTDRFKEALSGNAADLPAQVIADYNTLYATYCNNLDLQIQAKGIVAKHRSERIEARKQLATQLTKNVLFIAYHYAGNPSRAGVYFDQSILNAALAQSKRRVAMPIEPSESLTIFKNIRKGDQALMLKNTGSVPLVFGFTDTENGIVTPTPDNILEPNQQRGFSAGKLGFTTTRKYFCCTSLGDVMGGFTAKKV